MKLLSSLIAIALAAALSASVQASNPLPALGASADETSVSGLSSGAFMAVQYQVAYSDSVVGAGIVAGGPYYCAAGLVYANLMNIGSCMGKPLTWPLFTSWMVSAAHTFEFYKEIAPLENLRKRRIYVFSGTKDNIVYTPAVNATVAFFQSVGVPSKNIQYVKTVPSGHALITPPSFGNNCGANDPPYISHCTVDKTPYDQPEAILKHIYGNLNSPPPTRTGQLLTFNQREFAAESTDMADDAFLYVPTSCMSGGCKVHVAFHGCKQSAKYVQDKFYGKSSYNDWADSNNIIVLYPQVNDAQLNDPKPYNPEGCWDWVGYTGATYAFKTGPQMKAIHSMIERLTSPLQSPIAMTQ